MHVGAVSRPRIDRHIGKILPHGLGDSERALDIVYGQPRGEGLEVIPLGEETVTPLCAPEIARKIRKPKDLLNQVLIRSDVKRVQWHQWFAANGLEAPAIHGMRFDRSFLAIAMACGGVGVTLESTRLAEREIASRRLVAPLPVALPASATSATISSFRVQVANVAPSAPSWIGSRRSSRRRVLRVSPSRAHSPMCGIRISAFGA